MPGGAGDGYDLFNASIDEFGNMNWILDEDNPVRKKYIAAQKLTNTKKGERGIPRQTELAELFKNDTACNFGITHYILEEPAGNFEMREFNFKDEEGNKLSDFLKTAFTSDKKTVSNACANNQRYSVSMAVDHRGKLLHPILDEQLSSDTRKKLRDMLKEAPILNRNLFDPLSNGRERLKLLFGNLDKRHVKPEVLKTSDDSNTPWMSIRNNVVVNSTQEQKLSYYVMSSMRLGWINCDRFTNYPRATLVSLNLEIENPQVDEVMLVFETSQSAIAAYKKEDGTFISQPIPQNTNIKVVCMINDAKNPKIFTYGILSGRNKKFLIRENQNKGERDPGAEINTPA
jgi:hypothetical protein